MTDQPVPMIRGVEVVNVKHEGRDLYLLRDPLGIAREQVVLPPASLALLQFFDGQHTVADIQREIAQSTGQEVPTEQIESFVIKMDQALFLDSPHFREQRQKMVAEYKELPHRPAQFAGDAYQKDPVSLLAELDNTYRSTGGPGLPEAPAENLPAAIIAPHIDPVRGAGIYAQAYASIWGTQPKRIVILGICHSGGNQPFVLTSKDFKTPLGTVRTDKELVKKLCSRLSWDPCLEEDLHLQEHSVEFQNLFIQHALTRGGTESLDYEPLYIPILCAFPWQTFLEIPEALEIRKRTQEFLTTLDELLREDSEGLLIVAGVDFAHMGHRFGDENPLSDSALTDLQNRDMNTLTCLARGDRDAFIEEVIREEDDRRLCGFSALYSLLTLLPDAAGFVTGYLQAVDNHPAQEDMGDEQTKPETETNGITGSDSGDNSDPASGQDLPDEQNVVRSVVSFASVTFQHHESDEIPE